MCTFECVCQCLVSERVISKVADFLHVVTVYYDTTMALYILSVSQFLYFFQISISFTLCLPLNNYYSPIITRLLLFRCKPPLNSVIVI